MDFLIIWYAIAIVLAYVLGGVSYANYLEQEEKRKIETEQLVKVTINNLERKEL